MRRPVKTISRISTRGGAPDAARPGRRRLGPGRPRPLGLPRRPHQLVDGELDSWTLDEQRVRELLALGRELIGDVGDVLPRLEVEALLLLERDRALATLEARLAQRLDDGLGFGRLRAS